MCSTLVPMHGLQMYVGYLLKERGHKTNFKLNQKLLWTTIFSQGHAHTGLSTYLNFESLQRLDNVKKNLCEGQITEEGCLSALKSFWRNKTPRVDGLLVEFCLRFWNEISIPLVDCLNHGALLGELSISKRQGIISLIPKKNKDPLLLKNWRPISLLNTNYKLAMKCTTKQREKFLLHLIVRDQTGYTKDRFIGKNIRLISDIIKQNEKEEGVILFLEWFWKSLWLPGMGIPLRGSKRNELWSKFPQLDPHICIITSQAAL